VLTFKLKPITVPLQVIDFYRYFALDFALKIISMINTPLRFILKAS
tara:strand:- start:401 stop:538 length:138 start_codon:yes stop_codon:yes gene_type:complete